MSMGKGKNEQKVGDQQDQFAQGETQNFNQLGDSARGQITPYLATAPGSMSPLAAADYASSVENIGNTYQNLTQAADRQLGARGFGNAPSGFAASINNNIANQRGNAETGAYRQGLAETQQDRDKALSATMQEQSINNPNAAYSGADTAYTNSDNEKAKGTQELLGLGEAAAGMAIPGLGAAMGGFNALKGTGASMVGGGSTMMNLPQLPLGSYTPTGTGFGKYASTGPSSFGG